jgi:hypothetical protein
MPTFEVDERFWNEYAHLSTDQQRRFRETRDQFVAVLRAWEAGGCIGIPRFPRSLGVKPMASNRNVWELAWAPDGRCTWSYGTPRVPGTCHIVWRRIGSHAIYDDP